MKYTRFTYLIVIQSLSVHSLHPMIQEPINSVMIEHPLQVEYNQQHKNFSFTLDSLEKLEKKIFFVNHGKRPQGALGSLLDTIEYAKCITNIYTDLRDLQKPLALNMMNNQKISARTIDSTKIEEIMHRVDEAKKNHDQRFEVSLDSLRSSAEIIKRTIEREKCKVSASETLFSLTGQRLKIFLAGSKLTYDPSHEYKGKSVFFHLVEQNCFDAIKSIIDDLGHESLNAPLITARDTLLAWKDQNLKYAIFSDEKLNAFDQDSKCGDSISIINLANDNGSTPLHVACSLKDAQIARLLIQYGANVDASDRQGCLPFYSALQKGNLEVVKLFLNMPNFNVAQADKNGNDALDYSLKSGNAPLFELLIKSESFENLHTARIKKFMETALSAKNYEFFRLIFTLSECKDISIINSGFEKFIQEVAERESKRTNKNQLCIDWCQDELKKLWAIKDTRVSTQTSKRVIKPTSQKNLINLGMGKNQLKNALSAMPGEIGLMASFIRNLEKKNIKENTKLLRRYPKLFEGLDDIKLRSSLLHDLITMGTPDLLSKCIDAGFNPYFETNMYMNSFYDVVLMADNRMLDSFLENARMPIEDILYQYRLHTFIAAIKPECLEVIWRLCPRTERIADKFGWRYLELCNRQTLSPRFKIKIRQYLPDPLQIDQKDVSQDLIHSFFNACKEGNVCAIKQLLNDKKVSVLWRDERGYTPLHIAAAGGHEAIVEALIKHRADRDAEAKDALGRSVTPYELVLKAFDKFAYRNDNEVQEIDTYLNICQRLRLPFTDSSPRAVNLNYHLCKHMLLKAIYEGDEARSCESILNKSTYLDFDSSIEYEPRCKEPLLHFAARLGRLNVVKEILNKRLFINAQNKTCFFIDQCDSLGRTILWHYASYYQNEEFVKKILDLGLKLNHRDKKGRTVLHALVLNKELHFDTIEPFFQTIFDNRLDMNVQDTFGNTALHVMLYSKIDSPFMFNILLEHGARIDLPNKLNKTVKDLVEGSDLVELKTVQSNFLNSKA